MSSLAQVSKRAGSLVGLARVVERVGVDGLLYGFMSVDRGSVVVVVGLVGDASVA